MSRHATALALSTYLDEELEPNAAVALEEHLEECSSCRDRLRSMRQVTVELAGLAPNVHPPLLTGELERRLRSMEVAEPWLRRFERALQRWSLQSTLVPLFATLLAIAVMVVLMATGVEFLGRSATESAEPVAEEATALRRVVENRFFEQEGEVWFEVGTSGEPDRVLDLRGSEVPVEFAAFARIGAAVQLRVGDERLRILYR